MIVWRWRNGRGYLSLRADIRAMLGCSGRISRHQVPITPPSFLRMATVDERGRPPGV
jgi:hypothetical protein